MLRRANLSALVRTAPFLAAATRHGHHATTKHSFEGAFERPLTPQEQTALADTQKYRTVSNVVPGKLFMRHWIAAEQSTVSIVNRVISGIVAVCMMIWAAGYATMGYNGHNCAHVAGWTFVAYWLVLHTHIMSLVPVILGLALAELALN